MNPESIIQKTLQALQHRAFFKLICGGSFNDPHRLSQLMACYCQAGVTAIDVAATIPIVEAAIESLNHYAEPPLLMVSFPLDDDPHFRKIELVEADCIQCGQCLPVCPTQVFDLPAGQTLAVDTPVCYGCGRCVPVCPTSALVLDTFSVYPELAAVLAKPEVVAVEIHTTHADPVMIDDLYATFGTLLSQKLISVCLRPQKLPTAQAQAFLSLLQQKTPWPLIVQVDGNPMSGNADPEASLPAIEAAMHFASVMPKNCYLTISGGINDATAGYLALPKYQDICGVGMGTFARQAVWPTLDDSSEASRLASLLVGHFRQFAQSGIL